MKRIFLDTNILIDLATHRERYDDAVEILEDAYNKGYEICASTLSYANIAYVLRNLPQEKLYGILTLLAEDIKMLPLLGENVMEAIDNPCNDFEDMLQYRCTVTGNCEAIITNNKKDFTPFCQLPLYT